MRFAFALALLLAAPAVAAPRASDPAFLGIVMSASATGFGCVITDVTANGGAEQAGLRSGEVVLRIDAQPIPNCQVLVDVIAAKSIGESVKIVTARLVPGSDAAMSPPTREVVAQLGSRMETMRRSLLNRPIKVALVASDDGSPIDLVASSKGRATIVGWFNPACFECKAVLGKVAQWQRRTKARAYAATMSEASSPKQTRAFADQLGLDLPLAIAVGNDDTGMLMFERDRIMFTVIDCSGNVSYVAPIAPGSEDVDAMLDELFVAADHAQLRARP